MLVFSFSIWISTSRGCKQHIQSCTNEDTECCWWYHGWSPWRTCQICDETMLRLVLLFVFQSCCFELSTFFRCISDSFSMLLRFTFDQVSTHVRFNFDQVSMHVRFISNHDSHDLHFDELQVGLRRTMFKFPCYVNRGLWDAIPLPRTTPDKHVELSSQCVSVLRVLRHPGWMDLQRRSRLDYTQLMFPNGTREASVPWIKGRTAGPLSQSSQSGVSLLKQHKPFWRWEASSHL